MSDTVFLLMLFAVMFGVLFVCSAILEWVTRKFMVAFWSLAEKGAKRDAVRN